MWTLGYSFLPTGYVVFALSNTSKRSTQPFAANIPLTRANRGPKFVDHPTFEEIATDMGLRPRQVQGIYRQAIKKLRRDYPETLTLLKSLATGLHSSPNLETNEDLD